MIRAIVVLLALSGVAGGSALGAVASARADRAEHSAVVVHEAS